MRKVIVMLSLSLAVVAGEGRSLAEGASETTSILSNFAFYGASWSAEPSDPVWARAASSELAVVFDAFRDGATDVAISEVACRTTWCRVRLDYASNEAMQRFGGGLFRKWIERGLPCELHYPGDVVTLEAQGVAEIAHPIFVRCLR